MGAGQVVATQTLEGVSPWWREKRTHLSVFSEGGGWPGIMRETLKRWARNDEKWTMWKHGKKLFLGALRNPPFLSTDRGNWSLSVDSDHTASELISECGCWLQSIRTHLWVWILIIQHQNWSLSVGTDYTVSSDLVSECGYWSSVSELISECG